jgi:hypothetical protein
VNFLLFYLCGEGKFNPASGDISILKHPHHKPNQIRYNLKGVN